MGKFHGNAHELQDRPSEGWYGTSTQTGASSTASGWGPWCANTTTPSSSYAYLSSANAEQTSFWSDDHGGGKQRALERPNALLALFGQQHGQTIFDSAGTVSKLESKTSNSLQRE